MNERLQNFLDAENISQASFADTIGVARASVSHILAGRNKPGYDFISSMMKNYPKLNIEWLLVGKGKMYKEAPLDRDNEHKDKEEAPFYDDSSLFSPNSAPSIEATPENVPDERKKSLETKAEERRIVRLTIFYNDNTFEDLEIA